MESTPKGHDLVPDRTKLYASVIRPYALLDEHGRACREVLCPGDLVEVLDGGSVQQIGQGDFCLKVMLSDGREVFLPYLEDNVVLGAYDREEVLKGNDPLMFGSIFRDTQGRDYLQILQPGDGNAYANQIRNGTRVRVIGAPREVLFFDEPLLVVAVTGDTRGAEGAQNRFTAYVPVYYLPELELEQPVPLDGDEDELSADDGVRGFHGSIVIE